MPKTTNIFVRIEPAIKEQADEILDELGLTISGAVSLFLKQVVLHRGLPFDVKIPRRRSPASSLPEVKGSEPDLGVTADKTTKATGQAVDAQAELKGKYEEIARQIKRNGEN